MLRTLSIVLSLGLLACGSGGKPADRAPGDPDPGGDGSSDPGPAESATCCCETYDLETPDIGYASMAVSECTGQGGHCEDTEEYCTAGE